MTSKQVAFTKSIRFYWVLSRDLELSLLFKRIFTRFYWVLLGYTGLFHRVDPPLTVIVSTEMGNPVKLGKTR